MAAYTALDATRIPRVHPNYWLQHETTIRVVQTA